MKTVPVLQLSEANREALKRHFLALDAEDRGCASSTSSAK